MKKLLVASCLTLLPTYALAVDHGVYGGISTMGLGVGYKLGLTPNLGLRIGYNGGEIDGETEESGVDYDGELKFDSIELLADYHPWRNGFTVTAGLVYNKTKLTARGQSSASTITINEVTFTGTSPTAHYENRLDDDEWSPYLGVGWTSKEPGTRGLSFNARLGVLFQDPKGSLSVSGVSGATLEQNRAQAEQELNEDLEDLDIYPVVGVGLQYVF